MTELKNVSFRFNISSYLFRFSSKHHPLATAEESIHEETQLLSHYLAGVKALSNMKTRAI